MSDHERAEAIAIIEEARQSHVWWRDHFNEIAGRGCESCGVETHNLIGNAPEQQEWVEKYDLVLRVLGRPTARPVPQPTQGPPVFLAPSAVGRARSVAAERSPQDASGPA